MIFPPIKKAGMKNPSYPYAHIQNTASSAVSYFFILISVSFYWITRAKI